MKLITEKQKKERKFLLALPILTLPFLCLAFWAMGGGSGKSVEGNSRLPGLNMSLPQAHIGDDSMDKLESYRQAERKEYLLREQRRMDPFSEVENEKPDTSRGFLGGLEKANTLLQTEEEVQDKLANLQKLIIQSEVVDEPDLRKNKSILSVASTSSSNSVQGNMSDDLEMKRLEAMMSSVIEPEMEDPEMERIDAMLDKLLDVQHPQRVHERLLQTNALEREAVFSVRLDRDIPQEENFKESANLQRERNGFYSLGSDRQQSFATIRPAISAQVTKDQEVVTGASIQLELTQSVFIEGVEFIPGTPVTGVCTLNGERLNIEVQRIRSGNLIIPVNMTAIDLDALPGIKIPNAITRDAVKQGAGDGIQSMNMMGMSSSWEAQASMAGMETIKGILSKKAKLVKVTVKAGHPLLLADLSGN
ncbi:conjugative transposon TraM protein [Algoriphagus ratkowskyi]|uniref:Conjugative transposon TraM protein n=1 Tax=Algoriphagus ratkowskyi TaxID=57028 RepID=A0A2W7RFY4_9BACT|nr:conjugative transposon protein TraM [Algoriphagus ratkowskyi]PZX59334.1 conjugative transposon TraM protein [Algoriphagus ratkowskyi]TXD77400.1 conjugative transposon protein TraM [Algoriphagus ratkowskyi]